MTQAKQAPGPHQAREFTRADTRQVWARSRVTGDAIYLNNGDEQHLGRAGRQAFTRDYGCIIPTCDTSIIIRGGAQTRTHYAHAAPTEHPGESLDHYAAKHMLAQWLRTQPEVRRVEVEHRIVGDGWERRADVWATGADWECAYEVEYKPFPAEAWRAKHEQLSAAGINVAWFIGHTRLTAAGDQDVHLSPLARAITNAGVTVLAVNPNQRTLATLTAAYGPLERINEHAENAHITIEPITSCTLSPDGTIQTPQGRRVRAAAELRERKDEAAARLRAEADERWERIATRNHERWMTSKTRGTVLRELGSIPNVLSDQSKYENGIHGEPVHWHSDTYLRFIHGQPEGSAFTTTDVMGDITRSHGGHWDRRRQYRSVILLLERFEAIGLLSRSATTWSVNADLRSLGAYNERLRVERVQRDAEAAAERAEAQEKLERARKQREADERRCEQRRARLYQEWENSTDYQRFVALCGGIVPAAVKWPGDSPRAWSAFPGMAPERWRAVVWMRTVQASLPGTRWSLDDVLNMLAAYGIVGHLETAREAVRVYMVNLTQRGLLHDLEHDVWGR